MGSKSLTGMSGVKFSTFRLKKGVSEKAMLEAVQIADQNFFSQEEGLLWHVILRSKAGVYADVFFAVTEEKAKEMRGKWTDNEFILK